MGIDVTDVEKASIGRYLKEKRVACAVSLAVYACLLLASWFWFKECASAVVLFVAVLASLMASAFVFCAAAGYMDGEKRQIIAFGSVLASFCIVFAVAFPPLSAQMNYIIFMLRIGCPT